MAAQTVQLTLDGSATGTGRVLVLTLCAVQGFLNATMEMLLNWMDVRINVLYKLGIPALLQLHLFV